MESSKKIFCNACGAANLIEGNSLEYYCSSCGEKNIIKTDNNLATGAPENLNDKIVEADAVSANPKASGDSFTAQKPNVKKKGGKLKFVFLGVFITVLIGAAIAGGAYAVWRSNYVEMPNETGVSAGYALLDIVTAQGRDPQSDDLDLSGVRFIDDNGNVLTLSANDMQNKYEVTGTYPASGELIGKDEGFTIYIKKNAATIKMEREKASSKFISKWQKRFRAPKKASYMVTNNNGILFTFKESDNVVNCGWKMEQQEQDSVDLFAEKQGCNILLLIYSSDNYVIAAYNSINSSSSDEDVVDFIGRSLQKLYKAKKVTKNKKSVQKYTKKYVEREMTNGIESVAWGKDGNYLTFTVKVLPGYGLLDANGKEAKKNEIEDSISYRASQSAYLLKNNVEMIFIQDAFTARAKAKYKGTFFAHNDEFNSWVKRISESLDD